MLPFTLCYYGSNDFLQVMNSLLLSVSIRDNGSVCIPFDIKKVGLPKSQIPFVILGKAVVFLRDKQISSAQFEKTADASC